MCTQPFACRLVSAPLVWVSLALAACGPPVAAMDGGVDAALDAGPTPLTVGTAERPARVILPFDHDGVTERPLLVLLHGYGASSRIQDNYFSASRATRARGVYLLLPDGTEDADGSQFWNATEACCNFGGSTVDDVAYLSGLLDEVQAQLPIDLSRVYFMGHSNGGFMSYRMACEADDRIAAIAVLAGSDFADEMRCVPTTPPSVLHLHGTADRTIPYAGSTAAPFAFPSASAVVSRWAGRMGCDITMSTMGAPLDLASSDGSGAETTVLDYEAGCTTGRSASFWSMDGQGHTPGLQRPFAMDSILDWLLEHQR